MKLQQLTRIPWRILPAWFSGNRLRILMYHSISDNPRDPQAISPQEFKRQIQQLQSFKIVSLDEGLQMITSGGKLSDTIAITFDDALLDFYTHALPVIKEFSYPVTMFVPTGLVGMQAKWDSYDKSKPLMSWDQLEECQRWKVSFGSHTVNHACLTECDDAHLKTELGNSLATLNKKLENVIPALAYPGGYRDGRVRLATRENGYQYALGAFSRWGNGPETDLFNLRRERFH